MVVRYFSAVKITSILVFLLLYFEEFYKIQDAQILIFSVQVQSLISCIIFITIPGFVSSLW